MRFIIVASCLFLGAWVSCANAASPEGRLEALKAAWHHESILSAGVSPAPARGFVPYARQALDLAREEKGTAVGAEALRWTLEKLAASPAPDAALMREALDLLAADHMKGPALIGCIRLLEDVPDEITDGFLETVIARAPSPQARVLAWTLKAS